MLSVLCESRKHREFRESWVALLLGAAYFLYAVQVYAVRPLPEEYTAQNWFSIQQDIPLYAGSVAAFLIAAGLPRLVTWDRERNLDGVLRSACRGTGLVWRDKALYAAAYCAVLSASMGAGNLLAHGGSIAFLGASGPVTSSPFFAEEHLPPMTNLQWCALQYVLLFLACLYFAGFVLLATQITGNAVVGMGAGGAAHVLAVCWRTGAAKKAIEMVFGPGPLREAVRGAAEFLYLRGFGGYLLMDSWGWTTFRQDWGNLWKAVLLAVCMTALEFALWRVLWGRRARR